MTSTFETDVLVIGAGGAGMYAAISAARSGARVLLLDKSLIGRSGATVMAQMTVAAAVGEEEPDDWRFHLKDTIEAGRGLVNEPLARLLCHDAPARIREMDEWKVGWARRDGHMTQVHAPGHDRKRCVYVDFLNTGPAVSRTLRTQVNRQDTIRRIADLVISDIVVDQGRAMGAVGLHLESGTPVSISAAATVLATGGLTRLYSRNSASANMGGDGYALGLRAGAELIDMEFVQFFPIGHLAPRLIGMDPIMWDPFRYKLGGRLINSEGREFGEDYGAAEDGRYVITRDAATYAIYQEVRAGRGSPHGGAWLSFQHLSETELRDAFGPVIDRLADNGIDLTRSAIEVAPIAHYHMGGLRVDERMQTNVGNLFAAGEAVGGANGANRLSGNAISEALVFGEVAGRFAAAAARAPVNFAAAAARAAEPLMSVLERRTLEAGGQPTPTALIGRLQELAQGGIGPFRTADGIAETLAEIADMEALLPDLPVGRSRQFNLQLADCFELRNMLLVARAIAQAALARTESRGAHQREDHPGLDDGWEFNQSLSLSSGDLRLDRVEVPRLKNPEAAA
jgi:succinate dehydrogenase/fumarate reductase flavoprotein subunit